MDDVRNNELKGKKEDYKTQKCTTTDIFRSRFYFVVAWRKIYGDQNAV